MVAVVARPQPPGAGGDLDRHLDRGLAVDVAHGDRRQVGAAVDVDGEPDVARRVRTDAPEHHPGPDRRLVADDAAERGADDVGAVTGTPVAARVRDVADSGPASTATRVDAPVPGRPPRGDGQPPPGRGAPPARYEILTMSAPTALSRPTRSS